MAAEPKPAQAAVKPADQSRNHHVIDETFPEAKSLFKTFPSVAEIAKAALFVMDASTLTAPFDLGKELEDIERIVKDVADKGRLFVPERAAREFVRNRSGNMAETYKALSDAVIPPIPSPTELTSSALFSADAYQRMVESRKELETAAAKYRNNIADLQQHVKDWNCNDPISKLYESVFKPETFIKPDESEDQLSKEFSENVGKKAMVVPGSKDIGSPTKGDGGIGDFIIWKSILALGKKTKKDVIFVSGDAKDDWVVAILKKGNVREAVYAKFELISQYNDASDGASFAICSFPTFLKLCGAKEETVEASERAVSMRIILGPVSTAEESKSVDVYENIAIGRGAIAKQFIANIKLLVEYFEEFLESRQLALNNRATSHLLPRLISVGTQLLQSYEDYPGTSSSSSSSEMMNIRDHTMTVVDLAKEIFELNQWLTTYSDTISALHSKTTRLKENIALFLSRSVNLREQLVKVVLASPP